MPSAVPLPPPTLRFMNEDDERFLAIGREFVRHLERWQLTDDSAVLDVGSGYGRLAVALLRERSFRGRYEGFDLLPRHVAWCAEHLTAVAPNVRFTHVDLYSPRYNPRGAVEPATLTFPYGSETFTHAAVVSVFTHMFADDIDHYLAELRRTLRPDGVVVSTFFLFDDDRRASVMSPTCPLPMQTALDATTLVHNPDDPLHAIGFHRARVEAHARAAGFEVIEVRLGSWCGEPSANYQDVVVLRRS